ncbi:DUF2179 domain-containing protein [Fibrobacterota bacterium]
MEQQSWDIFYNILIGFLIFSARVVDVSVGTIRTISIVHGKTKTSFFLGLIEISLWLAIISTVLDKIKQRPYLGLFYAFGFATGNVVGIMLEKNLALGSIVLRLVNTQKGSELAKKLREEGYDVTVFKGESYPSTREDLSLICKRCDLKKVTGLAEEIEPGIVYTSEQAGILVRRRQPIMQPVTGWRAIFKKK